MIHLAKVLFTLENVFFFQGGNPPSGSSTGLTPGYNTAPVMGATNQRPAGPFPPNSMSGPSSGPPGGMPGPRPPSMGGAPPPRSTPQPPGSYSGPPASPGMPPTTGGFGQPSSGYSAPGGAPAPLASSYGQPAVSTGGAQHPGLPHAPPPLSGPTNMGMQPPASSANQGAFPPPQSNYGTPPTSQMPSGFPPTSSMSSQGRFHT